VLARSTDHLHFTPTSGSWLNRVKVFFGIIARQAIGRGTCHSVQDGCEGALPCFAAACPAAVREGSENG
jgi:hypothetical protein